VEKKRGREKGRKKGKKIKEQMVVVGFEPMKIILFLWRFKSPAF
jgi:hypothetical protein